MQICVEMYSANSPIHFKVAITTLRDQNWVPENRNSLWEKDNNFFQPNNYI